MENDDVDSAVTNWTDIFTSVVVLHASLRKTRVKGIRIPWMNPSLIEAMSKRDYQHRRAVKTKLAQPLEQL